jgi:16S rRNA pseudouridine516 synthase
MERLDKILSNGGLGSRKDTAKIIKSGIVAVDGVTVADSDFKVEPSRSQISVDGKAFAYKEHYHIMLNKPAGILTATKDFREKTVLDLIGGEYPKNRLFPAGRLDRDAEGFVLLTTDGALAHKITGPKNHVEKVYYVELDGSMPSDCANIFADGVTIDGGYKCKPAKLEIMAPSACRLTITEGKFHQVKRMFEAVGRRVVYLKRVKIGGVCLDGALPPGGSRELSGEEAEAIINHLHD